MQLKTPSIKFKKIEIKKVQKTLPVIVARYFTAIVLSGAVVALLVGVYYFYQNVYVLTNEDYSVLVSVRKVNAKIFEDVMGFVESRQVGSSDAFVPDPFRSVEESI